MFRSRLKENGALIYSVSCLSVLAIALWFGASFGSTTASSDKSGNAVPAATFAANSATLGAIPDNLPATPRDVTFTVTGLGAGPPSLVTGNMTFGGAGFPLGHTWVGDITALLIAPNGTSFTLFGRTGMTSVSAFGDSSDLIGPYNFTDAAVGANWWTHAAAQGAAVALLPGDYRTTQSGPQAIATTSPPTDLTAAFASVVSPNGTWTMRFTDHAGGDTGGVSAANLTLETAPAVVAKKNVDFDGDGKSDFSMARNNTPGLANNDFFRAESNREKQRILLENPQTPGDNLAPGASVTWYANSSVNQANNTIVAFGEAATDFMVPSDYDGDGKADIAIWRPGAPGVAAFYIFQSSNSVVRNELFGQTGDDTAITGDYDGDGKSDLASYRCPAIGGGAGQCFFFYRGSLNNPGGNVTYVPWGFGEQFDFFVNPGDFDGDGKFDFCIQRTHPSGGGAGQFVLLKSSGGVEYVSWGRNTDLIVPGDYDGDGKFDFMVSRTETLGGNPGRSYYLLTRTGGGTGVSPIRWGVAGDTRTPGDFDGDGKTDVAVWRASTTPSTSTYYVLRSSDGMLQQFQYGNSGDFAVPGWIVH